MDKPTRCAHCKTKFSKQPFIYRCVDQYHRKPLCQKCYHDPTIARATASNPDDPSSWWNDPASVDPEFEARMVAARKVMKKRRKALRELAHS
jgi:hypothetical protein